MIYTFIEGVMTYHFLQNALITSVLIGIVSGVIGSFIILRGMSLMGDAISHAVLPGVALSFILGIHFFIGAIVFAVMASVLITYISNSSQLKGDTAIGVTFSTFLALGVVLIGVANSSTDLFHILFGNVLAVQDADKWLTVGITGLVLSLVVIFYRPLLITSFDPMMAKAFGMKVNRYHYLLMMMLTLVSVTAMQSVGTILVVALLITPAATAFMYTKQLKKMMVLASLLGGLSSLIGLFIGFSFNLAAGSCIVLSAAAMFGIGFLFSPKRNQSQQLSVRWKKGLSVAALLLMGLWGISQFVLVDHSKSDKLSVVATNSIIADLSKEIGGDRIQLHSIVPVGKNPHEYEPLANDVKQVTDADVIFYNGLNLETGGNGWFTKLMNNANRKENVDYFAVSKGVDVIYLDHTNEAGKEDPHAWLNIDNGLRYAKNITEVLSKFDTKNASYYQDNFENYRQKLSALDEKAKKSFAELAPEKKLIVTSEGAFKYFSKAYDIPSAYIWEINTEQEGTPAQIKQLVDRLRTSQVNALFVESSVNPKPMQTVSKDSGIPIAAELFTDSIAEPGNEGDSYYNMMKWNLEKITEGLN